MARVNFIVNDSFNPMMMVNTSETDATRRLFQCTGLGVSMNDITKKFQRDPKDAPDLAPIEFLSKKKIVDDVADWCESMEGKEEFISKNWWTPILYKYEVRSLLG
jgi:hypothetical protein